jgi:hypothetical protein
MNMQTSNKPRHLLLWLTLVMLVVATACNKPFVYEVNTDRVSPPNANKSKLKTEEQYIAILYANLFQKALSANELLAITNVIMSIGDKDLAHEVIISNLMNRPDVLLPSDSLMRADVDAFVHETYERFLIRQPTEAELTWFRNFLANHPDLSAEMVYFAFALTNEYLYY